MKKFYPHGRKFFYTIKIKDSYRLDIDFRVKTGLFSHERVSSTGLDRRGKGYADIDNPTPIEEWIAKAHNLGQQTVAESVREDKLVQEARKLAKSDDWFVLDKLKNMGSK